MYIYITHIDCLDGMSCMAIKKQVCKDRHISCYVTPFDSINTWRNRFLLSIMSMFTTVNILCMDVVPRGIEELVAKHPRINFSIIDHHKGNQSRIDILSKYPNVDINYEPNSGCGATMQLLKLYGAELEPYQVEFYTNVAYADMWNKEKFPQHVYFSFGQNVIWGALMNIRSLTKLSTSPHITKQMCQWGEEWYVKESIVIQDYLSKPEIHTIDNHRVLFIRTNRMSSAVYSSAISHYLDITGIDQDVDYVAIFRDDTTKGGASLRLPNQQSNFDLIPVAKKFGGGGHSKACGCNKQMLLHSVGQRIATPFIYRYMYIGIFTISIIAIFINMCIY